MDKGTWYLSAEENLAKLKGSKWHSAFFVKKTHYFWPTSLLLNCRSSRLGRLSILHKWNNSQFSTRNLMFFVVYMLLLKDELLSMIVSSKWLVERALLINNCLSSFVTVMLIKYNQAHPFGILAKRSARLVSGPLFQVKGPHFAMVGVAIKKVNHFCTWTMSINVAFQLGICLLAKDEICRKWLPSSPCILNYVPFRYKVLVIMDRKWVQDLFAKIMHCTVA